MREDVIELTKREIEHWRVVRRIKRRELTQAWAGEVMGLSERQVRRPAKKNGLLGPGGDAERESGEGIGEEDAGEARRSERPVPV